MGLSLFHGLKGKTLSNLFRGYAVKPKLMVITPDLAGQGMYILGLMRKNPQGRGFFIFEYTSHVSLRYYIGGDVSFPCKHLGLRLYSPVDLFSLRQRVCVSVTLSFWR